MGLEGGIDSFAAADKLDDELQKIRGLVPGLLGEYHFKMLYDFLVGSGILPPRWSRRLPVCPTGGTAAGLRDIYGTTSKGKMALQEMLRELTHRVMMASTSWRGSDHMGSVGAALCWRERLAKASSSSPHASRYEQTSAQSWE